MIEADIILKCTGLRPNISLTTKTFGMINFHMLILRCNIRRTGNGRFKNGVSVAQRLLTFQIVFWWHLQSYQSLPFSYMILLQKWMENLWPFQYLTFQQPIK